MKKVRWLLPEGIDEIVPPFAAEVETLRRQLLDMYSSWGYDLVIPPMVEYLESLLTGTGADLDLKTFKLTDQVSGRMMGLRADMTPQVARIDAHRLQQRNTPSRLCYIGTVLHAQADSFGRSRSPLQIGAELFGHAGLESDAEIISLMIETLSLAGVRKVSVDIGHVGIFKAIARQMKLAADDEALLFDALQRKAVPEIEALLNASGISVQHRQMILALANLNGNLSVLEQAARELEHAGDEVHGAIAYVTRLSQLLQQQYPEIQFHIDLAELRGYHFHTGVVFAAYVPESGEEIARGGRYDNIGMDFGRARPATGFSADLKCLMQNSLSQSGTAGSELIGVIWSTDETLTRQVKTLRENGQRVIYLLPDQPGTASDMGCTHELVQRGQDWVVQAVS